MYITDLKAILPQKTYENELLQGEIQSHEEKIYHAIEPDYLELIPKGLLRRMGKAVRMGVGTGLPLIEKHGDIDAIIMGTANGGLEDCIKFLNQIVEYDEGVLTPTNFVQSTPNAVAGQLALMSGNQGYNITFTNGGLAFENALLDAFLLFSEGEIKKILLGGIEEISDYNYNIDSLAKKYKDEIVTDKELINSQTSGTICGEGSSMFVLENESDDYYAKIIDIEQITYPDFNDIDKCLNLLLKRNNLNIESIDNLILGYNGDVNHNKWYDYLSDTLLPNTNTFSFKNLIGDYRTCTSFAVWMAAHMLKGDEKFSQSVRIRSIDDKNKSHILIYNHFDEIRHGFILMSK